MILLKFAEYPQVPGDVKEEVIKAYVGRGEGK